jgi:hypothetical protein
VGSWALIGLASRGADVDTGAVDTETVREFIQRLTEAAGNLRDGADSPVELAICDGRDLEFISRIDVSVWTTVRRAARCSHMC